jgi:hypothetical protein
MVGWLEDAAARDDHFDDVADHARATLEVMDDIVAGTADDDEAAYDPGRHRAVPRRRGRLRRRGGRRSRGVPRTRGARMNLLMLIVGALVAVAGLALLSAAGTTTPPAARLARSGCCSPRSGPSSPSAATDVATARNQPQVVAYQTNLGQPAGTTPR